MQILTAKQQQRLDRLAIESGTITSLELMEKAAIAFFKEFIKYIPADRPVVIVCGTGNNGGDGMVIARLLHTAGYKLTVCVLPGDRRSEDFKTNEERLKLILKPVYIKSESDFPTLHESHVVIDALFGSGLNRPLNGLAALLVQFINDSGCEIFSVDIPSGMLADGGNEKSDCIVKAAQVFTFHAPKLAFFLPTTGIYIGQFKCLDIGLKNPESDEFNSLMYMTDASDAAKLLPLRSKFSDKRDYGHACICAGSHHMYGAAILSVKAALRSGAGLVSAKIPEGGMNAMLISNPEAICLPDEDMHFLSSQILPARFTAIGIGPGISMDTKTINWLNTLLKTVQKPLVLDADALNIIAQMENGKSIIPIDSVLTPHKREFERLFGNSLTDITRLDKLRKQSELLKCYIVLKGAYTVVAWPDGSLFFNSTGNNGMAKGGTGDVLTGLITGLMAQGIQAGKAALLGVYLHGLAGDLAKAKYSEYAYTAAHLVEEIGAAFKTLIAEKFNQAKP